MTTLMPDTASCSLCGSEIETMIIASTNELYPPDLDLRPGEMYRSTLPYWVRRCQSCGFVDEAEAEPPEQLDGVREVIGSEVYRDQLTDQDLPDLANEFLCRALIEAHLGDHEAAGWQALRAAWACDDSGSPRAGGCRERALEYWSRLAAGPALEEGTAAGLLTMADVARRAGRFDEAHRHCRRALSGRPEEPLRSLLEFETELITGEDREAHSIAEVRR